MTFNEIELPNELVFDFIPNFYKMREKAKCTYVTINQVLNWPGVYLQRGSNVVHASN